ncbi:MAG: rRNA large subunit methyltransferase I, partial [Erysipelotrichales bacterium]|nr:rRNA large subunit methyltransferase I [Erysipelotrichales bacterium]
MEKKLIIDETGARYLMSGQVWCYANNVLEVQGNPENGDITALCTKEGNLIGYGFYSAVNHIRARILSRNAQTVPDAGFFRERIKKAVAYRKTITGENFSNCRLIFGESDGLPGWVVDRYNDVLVSQISTAGIEKRKEELYGFLVELLKETGEESFCIYERNEIVARAKEGLPS